MEIGRFIIHMECMRDNLPEADFEEQENWVFNYHSSNVPTFTSESSSLHSMLQQNYLVDKIMGMNKKKKRQFDNQKKLERMLLKTYYDF